MKYLSTTMKTDWPEKEPWQSKVLKTILFFIPKDNPGYESKMHLVKKWLIEFEEEDGKFLPWREIGVDSNGTPVFAGPDKKNYGFWINTNMEFENFEGEAIDKDEFERVWKSTGVEAFKKQKLPPTRCIANRAYGDKLKVLFFEQARPKQSFDV